MSTHPFILQNDHEDADRPRQKSATAPAHRQPTDNNGDTANANSGTNQPRTVSVRGRSASDLSRLDADCARQLYTIRHHDRQDRRGSDVVRGSNDSDYRTVRGDYVEKGDELPINLRRTGGSGLARARGHVKLVHKRMGEAGWPTCLTNHELT